MALQKVNPLPAGRYWVDVNGVEKIVEAQAWFKTMAALQRVTIESTEHTTPDVTLPGALPQVIAGGAANISDWYLFRVLPPVPNMPDLAVWDQAKLGFPTIATADIHSKADTISAPDLPIDPTDQLGQGASDLLGEAKTLLEVIAGGVLLLGVAVVFSKK